jgi:hypothetical protein
MHVMGRTKPCNATQAEEKKSLLIIFYTESEKTGKQFCKIFKKIAAGNGNLVGDNGFLQ